MERCAAHSMELHRVKQQADAEAAVAKAAVRSRAHEMNRFHNVTGNVLPAPRVTLHTALHRDLVDRGSSPPQPQEDSGAAPPVSAAASTSPPPYHAPGAATKQVPAALSLQATHDLGQPRRVSDRVRMLDARHQLARQRLLAECAELQREHPHVKRPPPPRVVPVLREDGDDGR
uniref:Uncharacterized protein n=1 Tax=Neobodo designis TaxID=312471 RepID=A0A7S1L8D9_NEODS